jgi:hypothetical protein
MISMDLRPEKNKITFYGGALLPVSVSHVGKRALKV